MAFVVEDGTGLANANAYISVAFLKAYHADRGSAFPGGAVDPDDFEHGIVNATDFIDRRWRRKFIGLRLNTIQSLEFPRINAFYDDGRLVDGVPPEVEAATAELALFSMELSVPGTTSGSRSLAPNPTYDDAGRLVVETDEQVGPLREKKRFMDDGVVVSWHKYPTVEGLLRELLTEGETLLRA